MAGNYERIFFFATDATAACWLFAGLLVFGLFDFSATREAFPFPFLGLECLMTCFVDIFYALLVTVVKNFFQEVGKTCDNVMREIVVGDFWT